VIERIASQFPGRVVDNHELANLYPGWNADKIYEKTGIRQRHVVQEGECASDLAAAAAEKILLNYDRTQVDFLLLCTQTPDYLLPTTACVLQDRLKLSTCCGALDFNLGCSGYVYGLALAQSLIQGRIATNVLLLTAETYSRHIHPGDKSVRTIFGDAGAATLLSSTSRRRMHSFVLRTDGSGAERLMIRTGGARYPRVEASEKPTLDESGNVRDPNCLYMDGPEIFNFTLQSVPVLVNDVLAKAGLRLDEVDYFVFHQANSYMLEHLRRKLRVPRDRFEVCLEHCGNTVSATIPIALEAALQAGRIKPGMRILLAGFGVGFSWGGCILEWNDE
jgi:3-oxoacyl-[acyl-carrier-protein] synthase III